MDFPSYPFKARIVTGPMSDEVVLIQGDEDLELLGDYDFVPEKSSPEDSHAEMNAKIQQDREQALREDNPILYRMFPSTMKSNASGDGAIKTAKSVMKDSNFLGRGISANLDAIFNTPYNENPLNTFLRSMELGYDEAPEDGGSVGKRSFLGNVLHSSLKDPLAPVAVAFPVSALPGIGRMSPFVQTMYGGVASSAATEAARPLLVDDRFAPSEALKNIVLGTAIPVGIHGGKAGARGVERAVRGNYGKALSRLAELNNVESDALDLLSTPEGRAGLAANFRQEPDIADRELLSLAGFGEERFHEYSKWGDFLQREAASSPTVGTGDLAETMLGYGKRKMAGAGGGGLTSDEKTIARSLESDADIFFDPTPKKVEKAPLLLDQYGAAIVTEPPKKAARAMNAYQLNDTRKRIGALLDDEWKKQQAGRPDEEVKVLKDVYAGLRAKTLAIAEEKGEVEALDAYAKMAQKLGARDVLWDLARIGSNKYRAHQNAEKAVSNAFNSKNADHRALQDTFKKTDLAFGTNLFERSRYASHAKNLASPKHPSNKPFEPAGGSKWFNGRGKQELLDNLRGRTVKSAGEKLARIKELQGATEAMRQGFGWMGYGAPVPESVRLGISKPVAQEDEPMQDQYGFMLGR